MSDNGSGQGRYMSYYEEIAVEINVRKGADK